MTSNIRLIVLPSAERDVRDILRYTELQWGRAQRNAYLRELIAAVRRLQSFPELGRSVEADIREFSLRHHVVMYKFHDDTVTILRVMHPRRLRGH
jgi:toxin ParE1/3/4